MSYTTGKQKQFIDTNILVYAYDSSAGIKNRAAKKLISDLWETNLGCLSIQVLQEFHQVITRKIVRPLPLAESRNIIEDFSNWDIFSPKEQDVIEAIKIQADNQTSFWDAMIIQSANQLGCEIIWSEDLSHKQIIGRSQIINPFTQVDRDIE